VQRSSSCQRDELDLNPIEQRFAKLKTLLRKARARIVEATLARYRRTPFAPSECVGSPTSADCASA
jgi:hypothetical protein